MALQEEYERSGSRLFRWRSYVPVLLLLGLLVVVQTQPRPLVALDADEWWELACGLLALLGLAIRAATVGCAPRRTSGRNTRHQVAEQLNTTGMYSLLRHPLYLGNLCIVLGLASFPQLWWLTLLSLCLFLQYYERIMFAEEAHLRQRFGADFVAWSRTTPAWLPDPRRWQPPSLAFSPRNVLKREYNGAFAIVLVFTLFDLIEGLAFAPTLQPDVLWTCILPLATLGWLLLRTLKRYTRVLHVAGR